MPPRLATDVGPGIEGIAGVPGIEGRVGIAEVFASGVDAGA